MGNFAVATSETTLVRGKKMLEDFSRKGDKQEDALNRIFDAAESNRIKIMFPELSEPLKNLESIISALLQGVNAVVINQEITNKGLYDSLEKALTEKNEALEAKRKAESLVKQTKIDADEQMAKAYEKVSNAVADARSAKLIAEEMTENNRLLHEQVANLKEQLEESKKLMLAYDSLKEDYKTLENESIKLREEIKYRNIETARLDQILSETKEKIGKDKEKMDKELEIYNQKLINLKENLKTEVNKNQEVEKENFKIKEELKLGNIEISRLNVEVSKLKAVLDKSQANEERLQVELNSSMQKIVEHVEKVNVIQEQYWKLKDSINTIKRNKEKA